MFTGDTIWLGSDGGYSFIRTLAEDNRLAVQSLQKLKAIIKGKDRPITVITGHTGYSDDLDFVFAYVDQVCSPFSNRIHDPEAPYDGFDESDDTEESAKRSKREVEIKQRSEILSGL